MRFYIETYGCTLNRHDSELMAQALRNEGWSESEEWEADVIIINTCGVKDATEKRLIMRLQSIKKPLVVGGCVATADESLIRRFAPHAVLIGTGSVHSICDAANDALAKRPGFYMSGEDKEKLSYKFSGKVGIISISEGCTGRCAYCFTRLARPGLRSMRTGEILRRIRKAHEMGVREIQLTSQDAGAYGIDKGTGLAQLLKSIAGLECPNLKIRLGMMNPKHVIGQMDAIDIMLENDIFYKFFHIPQQSGSDSVLKVMGRENSSDDYLEIVRETRKDRMANIMTDIIVGHPGESEDDFLESMEIIRKSGPDTTNVSKYSARPGTPAAKMQQVERDTINERSVEMSGLCNRISRERNEAWVGSECEMVVFEANVRGVVGRNGHYKHIALQNAVDNVGNGLEVSIIGAGIAHLKGKLKRN